MGTNLTFWPYSKHILVGIEQTRYVNGVDLTDGIEWKHKAFKRAFGYYGILVKLQLKL